MLLVSGVVESWRRGVVESWKASPCSAKSVALLRSPVLRDVQCFVYCRPTFASLKLTSVTSVAKMHFDNEIPCTTLYVYLLLQLVFHCKSVFSYEFSCLYVYTRVKQYSLSWLFIIVNLNCHKQTNKLMMVMIKISIVLLNIPFIFEIRTSRVCDFEMCRSHSSYNCLIRILATRSA